MDIRIGAPVAAEDGHVGKVDRIVLHPQTREVDGIIVLEGRMLAKDVLIPIDYVLAADQHGVRVRGTLDDLSNLGAFAYSQYVEAPEEWLPPVADAAGFYLIPASPLAVGAFQQPATMPDPPLEEVEDLPAGDYEVTGSTNVYGAAGLIGRLDRVVTEGDTDRVTHLVVQRGPLAGRPVAIPADAIDRMDDDGIYLSLDEEQVDRMPTFQE